MNKDWECIERELNNAKLAYNVTDCATLGRVYTVIPNLGSPRCHVFDSSNKNQVEPGDPIGERNITDIVMHHTGEYLDKTLQAFSSGKTPFVNAHFIVTETGGIIQMVDPQYVARHAGASKFRGKETYNLFSIGIETVNTGFEKNGGCITKLTEYPK